MRTNVTHARGLGLAALTLALAPGCGGARPSYRNELRPPSPIVVSASINPSGVSVSPRRFGAGPVELIVTNVTGRTHELTLQTNEIGGSGGGIDQSTGPINPGDTARLKAELQRGRYEISIRGGGARALRVTAPRPSSQGQLRQP